MKRKRIVLVVMRDRRHGHGIDIRDEAQMRGAIDHFRSCSGSRLPTGRYFLYRLNIVEEVSASIYFEPEQRYLQ